MGALPDWASEDIDLTTPSAARMYDYYLGGAHNFAVDRELARKALDLFPDGQRIARANRAFLHRAVKYALDQGVRQFIDIGAGIPTVGNVHETAQRLSPGARVLYVDHDPVAVVHSELILQGNPDARVLRGDLRQPHDILGSAELTGLIDLAQPVAVLMVAVLHFVPEPDRPEDAIGAFRDAVAPGSYLIISHATNDGLPAEAKQATELYKSAADSITIRTRDRVAELFAGWELVEPGLVWVSDWRPSWPGDVTAADTAPAGVLAAGIGRKA